MANETGLRDRFAELGASLYDRGLTPGSSGNFSARLDDGFLLTPTNSCLGRLDPARITKLDLQGKVVSGDQPSKEAFLHLAMYQQRAASGAVVHLHSSHAVAVSVLDGLDPEQPLPPITAYYVMRIGRLKAFSNGSSRGSAASSCCPTTRPATSTWSMPCARSLPGITRSCSRTMARSWPVPTSTRRSTRPRNWRRPPSCSSCCAESGCGC